MVITPDYLEETGVYISMNMENVAKREEKTEPAEEPKNERNPRLKEGLDGQKFYIIQFPAGRAELGDPPRVPVNTPNYKAPQGVARNTPLPVPEEVVEAFDHAQYTDWQNVEGKERKEGTLRHIGYSSII